jgi:nucleoside-diphosphate-sugar epimerase
VGKLHQLGWKAAISLEDGIREVYTAFKKDNP